MKKQFVKDFNKLIKLMKKSHKIIDKLELDIDKPAASLYYDLVDLNVKALADIYSINGKNSEYIEEYMWWYVYDNNCGKNKLFVQKGKTEVIVSNVSQLYKAVFEL